MPLVDPATVRVVVAFEGTTIQAVQIIMECVVAEKSEEKYTDKNITLLLWLYDNDLLRRELL
eukprot:8945363-Ditylum_brightwellii.AAC.2